MIQKRTRIHVFNDTDKPLTVRINIVETQPNVITVEPQKQAMIFLKSDDVFFKVWKDNVVLFQDVAKKGEG